MRNPLFKTSQRGGKPYGSDLIPFLAFKYLLDEQGKILWSIG